MNVCPVLPRVVAYGDGRPHAAHLDHEARIRIELFLPLDQVRPGNIAVWDGCHNEADAAYYFNRSRAPVTPAELAAADRAVERYRAEMAAVVQIDVQRVDRLPRAWRAVAWA